MTATTDATERDILVLFFTQTLKIRKDVVTPIVDTIGSIIFEYIETCDFPVRVWALLKVLNEYFESVNPVSFQGFFLNCVLPLSSNMFF